ncbi:MAG: MFS transporter [Dehalococcoidia bacterium]|jgi:MFS family permease
MTTNPKISIFILLASATLTVMAGAIIAPVLNLIRDGVGVEASAARIIITTHSIFVAIFSPVFGIIIDRIGPKRPYIFGLALYGIAGGAGLFVTDYWVLLAVRALLGIGVAGIMTSITVLIFDLYNQGEERNKIMGWRASSQSVGGIVWPLLGGFLGTFSWHFPFAVYLIGIPMGLFVLLFIPEQNRKLSINKIVREKSVFVIFRENISLLIPYGIVFLSSVFLYSIVVFLPNVLENLGIISSFKVGLFISGTSLMSAVSAFMYVKIRAHLSYRTIVILGLAFWIIGFTTLSQVSSIWLIGISLAFFGIGGGMMMPVAQLWAGELVPASFRGRITSYLGSFGLGGQFLSPIILSPIASSFSLNSVFLVISIVNVILLLAFLTVLRGITVKTDYLI